MIWAKRLFGGHSFIMRLNLKIEKNKNESRSNHIAVVVNAKVFRLYFVWRSAVRVRYVWLWIWYGQTMCCETVWLCVRRHSLAAPTPTIIIYIPKSIRVCVCVCDDQAAVRRYVLCVVDLLSNQLKSYFHCFCVRRMLAEVCGPPPYSSISTGITEIHFDTTIYFIVIYITFRRSHVFEAMLWLLVVERHAPRFTVYNIGNRNGGR